MAPQDRAVFWSLSPEGHDTARAAGWQYTVYRCHGGWVWTREPAYRRLTGQFELHEATTQDSARRAVEEEIATGRRGRGARSGAGREGRDRA